MPAAAGASALRPDRGLAFGAAASLGAPAVAAAKLKEKEKEDEHPGVRMSALGKYSFNGIR